MRQIKFRAWTGSYYEDNFVIKFGKAVVLMYDEEIAKNDWILEQYTGLKDKNGVEIYSGDILSKTEGSENRIVKWGVGQWIIDGKTRHDQPLWTWERSCEVIGNIHEDKK